MYGHVMIILLKEKKKTYLSNKFELKTHNSTSFVLQPTADLLYGPQHMLFDTFFFSSLNRKKNCFA